MILNIKKFKREIESLKQLEQHGAKLSDESLAENRRKILLAIESAPKPVKTTVSVSLWSKIFRYGLPSLLGISLLGGTAFASGNAKPGDILYPVKRAVEQVRLNLAVSDTTKAELQAQFAQERLKELKEISLSPAAPEQKHEDSSLRATVSPQILLLPATDSTSTVSDEASGDEQNKRDDKNKKLRAQTKAEASVEVSNAIKALEKVRSKLQAKGDQQAAEQINSNILNLQNQAQQQDVNIKESSDDNEADTQNTQTGQPTSTPQNILRKRRESNGEEEDKNKNLSPAPEVQGSSTVRVFNSFENRRHEEQATSTPQNFNRRQNNEESSDRD